MRLATSIVVTCGFLLACLMRVIWLALEPVTRQRVERFADRQRLPITSDNGSLVIAYLATTRRWRVAGLLVGLIGSSLYAIVGGTLSIHFFWLFAGWFVGAVIAEWRINTAEVGVRRAALLVPRERSDYLSRSVRWLTDGAVFVTLGLGVVALARSPAGRQALDAEGRNHSLAGPWEAFPPWLPLLGAVLVIAAIRVVQLRVLTRRQPIASIDVIDADDAVRARSLRVLSGATIALMGYLAAPLVIFASDHSTGAGLPSIVLILWAPIIGWRIATGQHHVDRTTPKQTQQTTGALR